MRLRLRTVADRVQASLFFVPMAAVLVAVVGGFSLLEFDERIDAPLRRLPFGVIATVESARAVLTTIAGATISFAGIAFSVSLLIIQLASSQFSPRVVQTLFRDRFNKRVLALVVGTFAYCVVVLRSIRDADVLGDRAVVPHVSVTLAVILGVATILAIVAFIDHAAHSMDVSEILERVTTHASEQIRRDWTPADPANPVDHGEAEVALADFKGVIATQPHSVVRFDCNGWVQLIDYDRLFAVLEPGSVMRLDTAAGRYAIAGTPLCTIVPAPADAQACATAIRSAVVIGDTRTLQQDSTYGVRQLTDVALKALSPGINDPTTAQDAIFHAAAVLAEAWRRDPPGRLRTGPKGSTVLFAQQVTHIDLVRLATEEVRRAAANQPTVCVYLLEALELVMETAQSAGLHDRIAMLVGEARLVVAGCEQAGLLDTDLGIVRSAFEKRFGSLD